MNIGIIGAGNLGTGLTKHLRKHGHSVMLSFSKNQEKLDAIAASLGAASGSPRQALEFSEVVVLASPWVATAGVLDQLKDVASPKILWDCTNPLKPDLSGLSIGTTTSAAEEVARLAPWANVVKAIPPFAEVLHSSSMLLNGSPTGVFVCGDDPAARSVICGLVNDIGAAPFDCGPLSLARYAEHAGMLLVQLAYLQGFGARIGMTLLHEGGWKGERKMIVEYTRYRIPEDRRTAFIEAYGKAAEYLKASPHCVAYELAQCAEEADRLILRIEWKSIQEHLEGFRKSPGFADFFQLVKPFFHDIEEMQHYEPTGLAHRLLLLFVLIAIHGIVSATPGVSTLPV